MGEARLPDGCCCREEEAGRERVAAGKNGGVGVQNCQFARERAPIYRRNPRVRVSNGPNGLEWTWPKILNQLH